MESIDLLQCSVVFQPAQRGYVPELPHDKGLSAAFEAIGGFGMARVDFFLEGSDNLIINEINTVPGFTDISMYPRLWALSGLPLPALVDRLVAIALERHADRARLDQGIKDWIAKLSS